MILISCHSEATLIRLQLMHMKVLVCMYVYPGWSFKVSVITYIFRIMFDLLDKSFNHHCHLSQVELTSRWCCGAKRGISKSTIACFIPLQTSYSQQSRSSPCPNVFHAQAYSGLLWQLTTHTALSLVFQETSLELSLCLTIIHSITVITWNMVDWTYHFPLPFLVVGIYQ